MTRVKQFFYQRVLPALFWSLVLAAPAAAQSGAGDAAAVAEQIRGILFQLMLIGGPVMLLVGFAMMFAGGINPQWKQRGMEIIKWTFLGALGIAVAQGVLWGIIEPLLSSSGG
ncbi:MAG: hypothetical protein FOGNACKC_05486 [Anaerolineae bacterium]|nr:hypothetical protein [Anaerolineae bacterium]